MIGKTNSVIVSGGGGENTLKNLIDARKSSSYLFKEYSGTSIDDLIQYSDTENATDMTNMFNYCTNLTTIPQLNTSKVTTMNSMFYECHNLTSVPLLDTSNVTSMNAVFSGCAKLTTVPQLDTSKVMDMGTMFISCSKLTTIPLLDTSNVNNMWGMFVNCEQLTTVPALNANKVTGMGSMFQNCSNLKSILMTNIGDNLDIHYSTKFEREDLLVILNNLKTVTSSKTLTMGATNLAKLTDEDKAIAINKGWTLA